MPEPETRRDEGRRPAAFRSQETSVIGSPRNTLRAVTTTARPLQWIKNLLVFAAPATGGALSEPSVALQAGVAFVALCVVSSGAYFINDVVDAGSDRRHPTKRLRPIARGELSEQQGSLIGALLLVAGCCFAYFAGDLDLALVVACYVAIALSYTFIFRAMPLLDIVAIAGGFLIRAITGGVATAVTLSMWFLMVASFGSLFIATGKRYAELRELGDRDAVQRSTLLEYSESFLRYMQISTSTVTIAAYCLWAFEGAAGGSLWSELSIMPFVIGIFRYQLLLDGGKGVAPEDILLDDRQLQVLGTIWVGLVVIGVYVA